MMALNHEPGRAEESCVEAEREGLVDRVMRGGEVADPGCGEPE
jgi:hypothetical protein